LVLNGISHNYDFAVSTLLITHITQGVRLQGTIETTQAVRLPRNNTNSNHDTCSQSVQLTRLCRMSIPIQRTNTSTVPNHSSHEWF